MKWIVVKLSGTPLDPAHETGDDDHDWGPHPSASVAANPRQGRRDRKRSSCWAGLYRGSQARYRAT
jgi:hypothetical protein